MSDLERRALLGAAGVIGVAALSKISQAGPLTPPGGAVAPSGRTLTEIYDKIPAGLPNGTGDGRTPIAGAITTVTISLPGSYVLTGNITTAGTCILINSSDVTLDLNGFTLTCTNTTSKVLAIATTRSRIAIRNGRIVGGAEGISVNTTASIVTDLLLEDISLYNPKEVGIGLNYAGVDRVIVRRCSVLNPGLTSAASDTRGVRGISIGGGGNRVEACTVAGLIDNGTVGTTPPRGISLTGTSDASVGNVVAGCIVSSKTFLTGEGFGSLAMARIATTRRLASPFPSTVASRPSTAAAIPSPTRRIQTSDARPRRRSPRRGHEQSLPCNLHAARCKPSRGLATIRESQAFCRWNAQVPE